MQNFSALMNCIIAEKFNEWMGTRDQLLPFQGLAGMIVMRISSGKLKLKRIVFVAAML